MKVSHRLLKNEVQRETSDIVLGGGCKKLLPEGWMENSLGGGSKPIDTDSKSDHEISKVITLYVIYCICYDLQITQNINLHIKFAQDHK
jgi:hypothetical protein